MNIRKPKSEEEIIDSCKKRIVSFIWENWNFQGWWIPIDFKKLNKALGDNPNLIKRAIAELLSDDSIRVAKEGCEVSFAPRLVS